MQGVMPVPPEFVEQQFESVMTDSPVRTVKTGNKNVCKLVNFLGMLHSTDIVLMVASLIRKYNIENVVVDPGTATFFVHRL